MSDVLARIRVKEEHGIRRFLYPLDAVVRLPAPVQASRLRLLTPEGTPVPFQVGGVRAEPRHPLADASVSDRWAYDLSFCLFLAPHETTTLTLADDGPLAEIADPLQVTLGEDGLQSRQEKFSVAMTPQAALSEVVYDGVAHLRGSTTITRNGEAATFPPSGDGDFPAAAALSAPLHSWVSAAGRYHDGCPVRVMAHVVSSKSMIGLLYHQDDSLPGDEIVFTLPLTAYAPTQTCDFGVGGGTFGKLQAGNSEEILWRTEFGGDADGGPVRWSLSTAGRTDYVGVVGTAAEYASQCWFHLIDIGKALAVAIHHVPLACRVMDVTLRADGTVTLAFTLRETSDGPAEVSLTCHFLNDVPAIAAATNPQSLLLPPTVEVLPA